MTAITDVAIRAALEAGAIALEGFRAPDLEVDLKSDKHDLVTRYDRACEQHIRRVILDAYADSSIVGEEDAAHIGTGPLTWYVDPIDGTANFARGIALWAVSIGVARDGELIAGVIYDPASGQLFWADERGAFLREQFGHGEDRPMRSRGHSDAGEATVALNFPLARDLVHFEELALAQYAEITRTFGQVRGVHSTCIALAWVAAGGSTRPSRSRRTRGMSRPGASSSGGPVGPFRAIAMARRSPKARATSPRTTTRRRTVPNTRCCTR